MNKKIYLVLLITTILLSVLAFWSLQQQFKFKPISLNQNGVVLNEKYETSQFLTSSQLYQTWDKEKAIETSELDYRVAKSSILFYDNGNILFANNVTNINTVGVSNEIAGEIEYQLNPDNSYESLNNQSPKIENANIVKTATREYFLAAQADIMINNEIIGSTKNPQILIDKSGNVTLFSEKRKKRYNGHLKLKVNENTIFDVSQEKYEVNGQIIDLSKFGGTDNKKIVVKTDSTPTPNEENKNIQEQITPENAQSILDTLTSQPTQQQTQNNQNNSPNSKPNNSTNPPLQINVQLEELIQKLENLNQKLEKQVPIVKVNYISASVTSAKVALDIYDQDYTMLGQVKLYIIDSDTGKIIQEVYKASDNNLTSIDNLQPDKDYNLSVEYRFDLGDDRGIQTIQANGSSFKTQKASALYSPELIRSNDILLDVATDVKIEGIQRATINVLGTNGQNFTLNINYTRLSDIGEKITINNLQPETGYTFQLVAELLNGDILELNQSNQYFTLPAIRIQNLELKTKSMQSVSVNYDWESEIYTPVETKLEVKAAKRFKLEKYNYTIFEQTENQINAIIEPKEDKQEVNIALVIVAKELNTDEQITLTYPIEQNVIIEQNGKLAIQESDKINYKKLKYTNDLYTNSDLPITLVFERQDKDGGDFRAFNELAIQAIDQLAQAETLITELSMQKFNYRVVIYKGLNKVEKLSYTYLT